MLAVVRKMMLDSDLFVTNACKMMLKKALHVNFVMFYTCIQIFVEVSQIEIDYWFINILSNHDIKCVDDRNGMKEG